MNRRRRWSRPAPRHAVNPAWREAYTQMYPLYAMIYERMRPITDQLAALRS